MDDWHKSPDPPACIEAEGAIVRPPAIVLSWLIASCLSGRHLRG
jgi:hypothetical protein